MNQVKLFQRIELLVNVWEKTSCCYGLVDPGLHPGLVFVLLEFEIVVILAAVSLKDYFSAQPQEGAVVELAGLQHKQYIMYNL